MCTLSLVTGEAGYRLAMNRDEAISRGPGLPPANYRLNGVKAVYPTDGSAGTWIGANEGGITLALLNWNDCPQPPASEKLRSRGLVIPNLLASRSLAEFQASLDVLDLQGMFPFRLVGVFPSERALWEWRWDSQRFSSEVHEWESRHWFSSGLSDEQAHRMRGTVCGSAWSEPDAGTSAWLRRLHASHESGHGPFSMCVHREGVESLSYSEVSCTQQGVRFGHFVGSPCRMDLDRMSTLGLAGRWPETGIGPAVV